MEAIIRADAYFSQDVDSPGEILEDCLESICDRYDGISVHMGEIKSKPIVSSIKSVESYVLDESFGTAYWFSFSIEMGRKSGIDEDFKSDIGDLKRDDVNIKSVRTLGKFN